MLTIKDLEVQLVEDSKKIISNVTLSVKPGEVHLLKGRNGSGKSTLASILSGDPRFEITSGSIKLTSEKYPDHIQSKLNVQEDIDLSELSPDQIALAGIFVANQYPIEIPGVNLSNFLRMAYNLRQKEELPVFKFRKLLKETASLINFPEELLDRNLNEGFSGGEKKKTEILQMAVLKPRYVILDETDSGLDTHATDDVFLGIEKIRKTNPQMSFIVITHYNRVLDYLKPDFTHTMEKGVLISEA